MGEYVGKKQCPKCFSKGRDTSEDNLAVYSDGFKCFSCGYYTKTEGKAGMVEKKITSLITGGVCRALEHRGISKAVCEHFGYQVHRYTGVIGGRTVSDEPIHIANYHDGYGQIYAQKIRTGTKDFKILGDGSNISLYGKHLYKPSDKIPIIITEGEIDALSVAQARGKTYPVVSVPNGAGSAHKVLKNNIEWLSGFKFIILAFDSDEECVKASKKCSELFDPCTVKVARFTLHKDANGYIVNGRDDELRKLLLNADEISVDDIVTFSDVQEEIFQKPPTIGYDFPWPSMTSLTYGIRPHELFTVMAGAGIGKTEFISDIVLDLINHSCCKVGLMSFEQPAYKTYTRMIGKILNKRIHKPGEHWDEEEIERIGVEVLQDKLYCYRKVGACSWEKVMSKLNYMVKGKGCSVVVIDNLSSVAAKFDKDERRGIDQAMMELEEIAMSLGITVFLVCHLSKPPKDQIQYDQGRKISLSDARGSDSIGQCSTYVIGLERDTQCGVAEQRAIMTVRFLKDREFGDARGCTVKLKYNKDTGRLEEFTGI